MLSVQVDGDADEKSTEVQNKQLLAFSLLLFRFLTVKPTCSVQHEISRHLQTDRQSGQEVIEKKTHVILRILVGTNRDFLKKYEQHDKTQKHIFDIHSVTVCNTIGYYKL